jgi:hypothetical protein
LRPALVDIKETKSNVRAALNFRSGGYAATVAIKYCARLVIHPFWESPDIVLVPTPMSAAGKS